MQDVHLSKAFNDTSVLILGGDGFCGWPTALRFSVLGARIVIADNSSRRRIDQDLGTESLTKISSLPERIQAWEEETGSRIGMQHIDLASDYSDLCNLLKTVRPDIIVHFAEQRSAPYSMVSSAGARYSVDNNIMTTHNLLAALAETKTDAHLIHLGTIGVYGYSTAGLRLPEGYLTITAHGSDGRDVEAEIVYPGKPDSIYHLTKSLDQQLFAFYARYYGTRITDLHQGIVWGTQTSETRLDPRLVNRFDHDAIYGTVVNRFILQALQGKPLTVYGSGEQARAYVHIEDMLTCITLAAQTPPGQGKRVRIVNQFSEICSINSLASLVSELTGAEIGRLENPRREPEGNEFDVSRNTLIDLGFEPRTFNRALAAEVADLQRLCSELSLKVNAA
jgi:UDP-sulfoquinovose synthase